MPTQCFVVANMREGQEPGAMWPIRVFGTHERHWLVRLPNRGIFDIHSKSADGTPWTVTGQAPNFTVSPSVNYHPNDHHNGWHGWLQNGILTDDCEGRRYD